MTTTLRTWNLKISLSLLLCLALCGLLSAQTPTWQYVSTVGGNGQYNTSYYNEKVRDMTVDKWGNTFIVGKVGTSPDANGTAISPANYGDWDAYVAKFNRCGTLEWCYVSGGIGDDGWSGVVVDTAGNCYIDGNMQSNTARFIANGLDTTFTGQLGYHCIFKLSPKGKLQWNKVLVGSNFEESETRYIEMSPNGNLYFLLKSNATGITAFGSAPNTHYGHMLGKLDPSNGTLLRYAYIDSLQPSPFYFFRADNKENLYVVPDQTFQDTFTHFYVGGKYIQVLRDAKPICKLDTFFKTVNYRETVRGTYGISFDGYEIEKGKILFTGNYTKGSGINGQIYSNIHCDDISQAGIWMLDTSLNTIHFSTPDTAEIDSKNIITGSGPNYYMLQTSQSYLRWGNVQRPFSTAADTTRLVKVNFENNTLDVVDKLLDFRTVQGNYSDVTLAKTDEQGNVYYAGLLGDKITIPGKSVTPKGGQPSPDGFVLKWGLPCSDSTHALIPPKDPSKLIATAASATRVNVNWSDNAQYETGYRIFRSPDGISNWTKIDSVNKNVTAYADLNVQPNNVYWYKVQGYNAIGATDWTNIDSARTPMTIGITEITGVSYFNVFPNPTKGNTVTIELAQDKAAVYQVALTDLSGRTLQYFNWNTEAGSNKKTIEVSGLSKGIYSLSLRTASARLTRELVVVE